jgi:hypothetical protein
MGIRTRIAGSALLMGATTALVIGVGISTAVATNAITFTVSPGGSITAKAGKTTLTDSSTGSVLSCTSSSGGGSLKSGTGLSGTGIGSITALSFTNCTGPLGLTFTVATSGFPYKLNATAYNATTGVTTGKITGIKATLNGPSCTASVAGTTATTAGTVKATYTNSTHKLKILTTGGTLHVWNVSGCAGLINSGDATTFSGSYTITPAQTITSP